MKKTLVALAVLAASGASMAQSSVTLYGLVDMVLHKDKNKITSVSSTALTSGGVNTSRFGFKGTEDLGGGLKANFLLEQGFALDTGAAGTATSAGQAFDRQAYVGLSGGFGEVKLGKVFTAYDDFAGATNPVFNSNVLSPGKMLKVENSYNDRPANGLYYSTPSFSGFSGAISTSLAEGNPILKPAVPATLTTPFVPAVHVAQTSAFHVKYEGGPVVVGLAYQVEKATPTTVDTKFTRLNASYDFGVAKVMGGYGLYKPDGGTDSKEMTIGVDVPVSANLTLSAGYASSKPDNGKRADSYAAGAAYSLSKRTTLYGGVRNDNDAAGGLRRVGAGVMHTF